MASISYWLDTRTGKEVTEIGGDAFSEVATLIFVCVQSSCKADGVEFGMSLDDFCALTPKEFAAVSRSFNEAREAEVRGDWERMRTLALFTVQPYCKRKVTAKELMRFPWDDEGEKKKAPERSTRERMEELERRIRG